MNCDKLIAKLGDSRDYTLHCHTQFCDGRADMEQFVVAAIENNFSVLGFTPHSPIPIESSCNMRMEEVEKYFAEIERLKHKYSSSELEILTSMEVDYLSPQWGAHSPYFASLPLDYIVSSIHFIPTQEGELVDIDGRYDRFHQNVKQKFHNDIEYVVNTFLDNTLTMLELGGFQIVGHFDKIALNGSYFYPELEQQLWYIDSIMKIIHLIAEKGYIVEINTKAFEEHGRFFPHLRWWKELQTRHIPIVVNSDAHYPARINASRDIVLQLLS